MISSAFLTELQQNPEWGIALAAGGWKRPAEFKIRAAGLPLDNLPAAFAEDGPSGLRLREHRRGINVGNLRESFLSATPFGTSEPRATLLRAGGVKHIDGDFLDPSQCLQWLEDATVPANDRC